MSSPPEESDLHEDPEVGHEFGYEFGGKRKHKNARHTKKQHKNIVIVGKVYADWCGHCQALKPEWAKMKKHIHRKKGRRHVIYEEIEEKQIGKKLNKLNQSQHVNVEANGYPTLFRIENGKVDYYNGNRQSNAMADWYLRGGDPLGQQPEMPGLLQDQQGGRRDVFTRRHGFDRRSQYRGYKGTRKNDEKKTSGFFNFLFGK